MQKNEHDLVVIGAGPGGYVGAIRAAQLGLRVACVEREPLLGGTCLRVGCIPSKSLLDSSHKYAEAVGKFASYGIQCSGVTLDLPTLLKRKDQAVLALTKGVEALLKKNKITRYHGNGRLLGGGRVLVEGAQESHELSARYILLATGSTVANLPGVELSGDRVATSTEALSFPEVPQHLVVIGGGYIGLELGSVWRRLGAKVTVLEFLDRILAGMDADLATEAARQFAKQGLEFRLKTRVTSARFTGSECIVECEGARAIQCDRVLVAVGRKPCTEKLGLDAAGVKLNPKGQIVVDAHYRTSAEGVYAIGDVIPGPMLAHKAEEEAVACVEGIVTGHGHVHYDAIPAVAYTDPEIGSVGKTEEELVKAGVSFKKGVFNFRGNGRARTIGQVDGFVKVLADAHTDRLLGVHIIGPSAGDLINEAAAAISFAASAEDLARCCHAHPTLGEALKEAALAVGSGAIHM
jgi:dihydrolipoamide dehydrogenase